MKKKIFSLIAVCLTLCCVCCVLIACDSFSTDVSLTLHVDDRTYNYTVSTRDFNVPAHTKEGYYLAGYYDSPTGGTMFIDGAGKAVNKWKSSNPTTLYAQWKSIDNYKKVYNYCTGNPFEYQNAANSRMSIPAEEATVMLGNRDKTIDFKIKFSIKRPSQYWGSVKDDTTTDYGVQVRDRSTTDSGSQVYVSKGVTLVGPEWDHFVVNLSCSARVFTVDSDGSLYAYITIKGGAWACYNYVKDIEISFSFQ